MRKTKKILSLGKFSKRIVIGTFIGFVALLTILQYYDYRNSKRILLQSTENAFNQRAIALDASIYTVVKYINILKSTSEQLLNRDLSQDVYSQYQNDLIKNARYVPESDYYIIEPDSVIGSFQSIGTMFAKGYHHDLNEDRIRWLIMGLGLLEHQKSELLNNSNIIMTYVFGTKLYYSSLYPVIPGIEEYVHDAGDVSDFMDNAGVVFEEFSPPLKNPERKYFWTDPYLDTIGGGMMVTCGIPIDYKSEYYGFLGADVSLKFLDRYTHPIDMLSGNMYIVSRDKHVISATGLSYSEENDILMLDDIAEVKNGFVLSKDLESSPWTLMYIVGNETLSKTLLSTYIFKIFYIALIVIVFSIGYILISRYFIRPGIEAEKQLDKLNESLKTKVRFSERRNKRLIENLGSEYFFYSHGTDGIMNYVSPSVNEMLGYTEAEFMKHYNSFLTDNSLNEKIKYYTDECLKGNKQKPYLIEIFDILGNKRWLEVSENPIFKNDEVVAVEGIAHDVTDKRKTDEILKRYRKELEDEVNERTIELQSSLDNLRQTQDQLIESERMASLGSLVAGVAHEINTPVGIGVTAASYLDERTAEFAGYFKSGTLTREKFSEFFKSVEECSRLILSNITRAATLIQSFKQVAVDQSTEELREFRINEYISEVLSSLHPKIKKTKHNIFVDCKEEIELYSYPGAISQILTNLLLNSLKHAYTDSDEGTISIKIIKRGANVKLIYKDDGKGIPQEIVGKIFDPFFTTKRGQGGSGLGMHIVYNHVKQTLKGDIKCRSSLGIGTEFDITFPCVVK